MPMRARPYRLVPPSDSEEEPVRGSLAEKFGLIVGDVIEAGTHSSDQPASCAEEIYLRLHLLSQRIVKPCRDLCA
jgi:hypothetical protein